ncbi:hypothetical protein HAX54_008828, partial [Datura stramonium]|nr:hypothetical protein [Datura stramonium]
LPVEGAVAWHVRGWSGMARRLALSTANVVRCHHPRPMEWHCPCVHTHWHGTKLAQSRAWCGIKTAHKHTTWKHHAHMAVAWHGA